MLAMSKRAYARAPPAQIDAREFSVLSILRNNPPYSDLASGSFSIYIRDRARSPFYPIPPDCLPLILQGMPTASFAKSARRNIGTQETK
jgi:hypothetical protein